MKEQLDEMIGEFLSTLKISSGWIVAILVLGYIILNPEKAFLWKSALMSIFKNVSLGAEKSMIGNKLRGEILKVTKEISKENHTLMPYDLKIEWVETEEKEAFIANNQVIVRMSHSRNPHKNLIYAMLEYVQNGLIPDARIYMDQKLLEAADLTVIRKMLAQNYKDSLAFFHKEILDPVSKDDEDIKSLVEDLIRIDNNGMFTSILLNEFQKVALSIYPEPPDDCLKYESKEFLSFLKNIAIKEPGEISELVFNRDYFKVAVGLAADPSTYTKRGNKYYIDKVFNSIDKGIDTVYILALGNKIEVAEFITESAKNNDIRIKDVKYNYYRHKSSSGRFTNGVCAEVRTFTKLDYEYENIVV